jgi:hypothetical protein
MTGIALLNELRKSEILADVLTRAALSPSTRCRTFSLQHKARNVSISRRCNLTLRDVAGYSTDVPTCWHRKGLRTSSHYAYSNEKGSRRNLRIG